MELVVFVLLQSPPCFCITNGGSIAKQQPLLVLSHRSQTSDDTGFKANQCHPSKTLQRLLSFCLVAFGGLLLRLGLSRGSNRQRSHPSLRWAGQGAGVVLVLLASFVLGRVPVGCFRFS
jgi:hypothetical protein